MRVPGHRALVSHAVRTRLIPPHHSPAAVVRAFLRTRFCDPFVRSSGPANRSFVLDRRRSTIAAAARACRRALPGHGPSRRA